MEWEACCSDGGTAGPAGGTEERQVIAGLLADDLRQHRGRPSARTPRGSSDRSKRVAAGIGISLFGALLAAVYIGVGCPDWPTWRSHKAPSQLYSPAASSEFVGCFPSYKAKNISDSVLVVPTFATCERLALQEGAAHFGVLGGGAIGGSVRCLLGPNTTGVRPGADLHCDGDRLDGPRLGSPHNLALYKAPAAPELPFGVLEWELAHARAAEVEWQMTDEEARRLVAGMGYLTVGQWVGLVKGVPRLGVPHLRLQDASQGFRPTGPDEFGTVTSWPSLLALAASWDPALVRKVAVAIAREFKGKGANVLLGPGVNVHRSPFGGRNWEYISGEDPTLGSKLASAYVEGVQGEGVMAVVKHYAFNEQETWRVGADAVVDEKTAWELYYPPFQAAIDAGVSVFMCSYNKVNGTQACSSSDLLNRDLRSRMGFRGFVMSDWEATHSSDAIMSGLDQEQPAAVFFSQENLTSHHQQSVRAAVRRVLAAMFHLRMDVRPGCPLPCDEERASNQRSFAHISLSRQAAADSVVLLQNDGVLPLDVRRVRTLAVIGPSVDARDTMNIWGDGSPYAGGGSGHVASPFAVSPLAGIRQRAAKEGIQVLGSNDSTAALELVDKADVVIFVGATTATEGRDRDSLDLESGADDLIAAVALKKPTVVLLEVPGAVLTPWRHAVAAVACVFHGGEQIGNAWAEILFGDVNPAGKLPITFPQSTDRGVEMISTGGDPASGGTAPVVAYHEGLHTGYRSQDARAFSAYPFGHGLSYTRFEFGVPHWDKKNCAAALCIGLKVRNVGRRAGREVVQAYVQFWGHLHEEPPLLLKGFHKTALLQPGEEELVQLSFTDRDLSTWETAAGGWVRRHRLAFFIGASAADLRHELLPDVHL